VPSPPPAPPAPSQDAQLADMQTRALEAERKAREAAEERARQAENALKIAVSQPVAPPTAPGGAWPAAGGTGGSAMSFAEELRTRCDAEIVQSGDTVVIRLADSFRSGSDQLKPDVKIATSLHAIADALMRNPNAQVAVVGHTDGTPIRKTKDKWTDNVHLSRARAETVAKALADQGVAAGRMSVDGRGDVEPLVYPERTSSDRARNRRVEIHVRF
jgi:flagellar motor protein MotB